MVINKNILRHTVHLKRVKLDATKCNNFTTSFAGPLLNDNISFDCEIIPSSSYFAHGFHNSTTLSPAYRILKRQRESHAKLNTAGIS